MLFNGKVLNPNFIIYETIIIIIIWTIINNHSLNSMILRTNPHLPQCYALFPLNSSGLIMPCSNSILHCLCILGNLFNIPSRRRDIFPNTIYRILSIAFWLWAEFVLVFILQNIWVILSLTLLISIVIVRCFCLHAQLFEFSGLQSLYKIDLLLTLTCPTPCPVHMSWWSCSSFNCRFCLCDEYWDACQY